MDEKIIDMSPSEAAAEARRLAEELAKRREEHEAKLKALREAQEQARLTKEAEEQQVVEEPETKETQAELEAKETGEEQTPEAKPEATPRRARERDREAKAKAKAKENAKRAKAAGARTVAQEEQDENEIARLTKKDLKKLTRAELLELLVYQTKRVEKLRAELDDAKEQLSQREIHLQEAGTLSEAALRLNRIFEDADLAAKQYLENITKRNQ